MTKKNKGYQTRLELQVLLSLESVLDNEHPKATEGLQDYLKRKAQRIVAKFLKRVQKVEDEVMKKAKKRAGNPTKKQAVQSVVSAVKKSRRNKTGKTPTKRRAVSAIKK